MTSSAASIITIVIVTAITAISTYTIYPRGFYPRAVGIVALR
jgi:hypothetical protein